ncbi:MAG: phosphatase PAP2 family protein [Gemmatales bacterium]
MVKSSFRLELESLEDRLVLDSSILKPTGSSTALVASAGLASVSTLGAEQILRWNNLALQAIVTNRTAPPLAARQLAILSIAMYDAANTVKPVGTNYLLGKTSYRLANIDVAVGTAAFRVLSVLFPGQKALFKAELQLTMSQVKSPAGKMYGQVLGYAAANKILNARAADGSTNSVAYTSSGLVGRWQPTPPAYIATPTLPQWPGVTPFALSSGSQFRPPVPPGLTSQQYADDLNEVKSLGSATSATRTADQTEIARFWSAGAGTVTPPGMWNVFAQQQARSAGLSTTQTARLFATLNVAMADAGIACWDAKYVFDMWRPVTAIRQADADGNAATEQDATWTPLLVTPPFPTYTSGHSTFSAAAAEVLSAYFGANTAFSGVSDSLPGVTRSWTSFRAAAAEAGESRVYGGIHFRFDSTEGLVAGVKVGEAALQRFGMSVVI